MQDFEVKKTAIEIHVFIFSNIYVGVSLNGGTPISHPKMIIFSRKNHGCWGKPIILGNHHIMGFPTTNSTYHERFSPSSSPTFFWVFQLAEGLENLNDFPYAIFVVRTKKLQRKLAEFWKYLKMLWKDSEGLPYFCFQSKNALFDSNLSFQFFHATSSS